MNKKISKEEIREMILRMYINDANLRYIIQTGKVGGTLLYEIEKIIKKIIEVPIKRKPLEDGTLPLTKEELKEFCRIKDDNDIKRIFVSNFLEKHIRVVHEFGGEKVLYNVEAISYLLEMFDLTDGDKND